MGKNLNDTTQFAAPAFMDYGIKDLMNERAGIGVKGIKHIRRDLTMVVYFCKMYGIIKNKYF